MSRKDDIKKLIANCERRLQKRKEQQALFGLDTPPHILTEIEDIETEIEKLQTELEALKDSGVGEELRTPSELAKDTKPKQRAQVYLQGDFPLSAERQSAAIDAFAAVMGISPQEIEVYRVYEGSIVFDLGIPSNAVQRLRSLLQSNSPQLRLLRVEKVILEGEAGEIEEWIIKEGRFDLVTSTRPTTPSGVHESQRAEMIELLVAPIPPDTVATVKAKFATAIREILKESGQANLWETGEIRVEVEKATSLEEQLVVVGVQLLSTVAVEAFKTIVLPRLQKRFEVKKRKHAEKKGPPESTTVTIAPSSSLATSKEKRATRPTVFVSYSHKDEKEKDELLSHLGVLVGADLIDLWSDDRIGAGADWETEISQAIAKAEVTILLISANFLTSKFILQKEVPELLKRRDREGITVFPVIAKACAWKTVDWLAKMNVRPQNGNPVWSDYGSHVDKDLAAIAEEVADIVRRKD